MEALSSSETSVITRATQRNIPDDAILHSHRREKPQIFLQNLYVKRANNALPRLYGRKVHQTIGIKRFRELFDWTSYNIQRKIITEARREFLFLYLSFSKEKGSNIKREASELCLKIT
jgi:hypothetical protein